MTLLERARWGLLLVPLWAGGCNLSGRCGPGTEKVDGVCVPAKDPVTCAEGTVLSALGQCEPIVACGEGTTYNRTTGTCDPLRRCGEGTTLDPNTNRCVSDVSCGEGTVFNTKTRTCEPEQECGEGTVLVDGACIPVNRCGPGTVFVTDPQDPNVGMCMPLLSCAEGLLPHENVCLTAAEIAKLFIDVQEPLTSNNDPALGGTPEPLTLEPLGEQVVFAGTIGRPVDLDFDGDDDQDLDAWSFTGTAGTVLRITLLNDGLPQPAFRLTGPDGFLRESRLGGSIAAERKVILPVDGTYTLTVAPAIYWAAGVQLGGSNQRYVGVIQQQLWPAAQMVEVSAAAGGSKVSGAVLTFDANLFGLYATQDAALRLSAVAEQGGTEPVLVLFTHNRTYLGEVSLTGGSTGPWTTALSNVLTANQVTQVLVDWRRSDGSNSTFDLLATRAPIHLLGDASGGGPVVIPPRVIPPAGVYAISFDVDAGLVATLSLTGAGTGTLSGTGPDGIVAASLATNQLEYSLYARQGGRYTWVYVNGGADEATVSGELITSAPATTGLLDPAQSQAASATGPNLYPGRRFFDRAWVLIEGAGAGLYQARLDYDVGRPDFELYSVRRGGGLTSLGKLDARAPRVQHTVLDEPGLLLVRVEPSRTGPSPVLDWWLDVGSFPAPVTLEVEPNDDPLLATPIGAGQAVTGVLSAGEVDTYFLTLPGPLFGNQALSIMVESLDDSALAPKLTVYDSAYAVIATMDAPLLSRPVAEWVLLPFEGSVLTEFYIGLAGVAGSVNKGYLLHAQPVLRDSELEPNNTLATAENLGTLTPGTTLRVVGNATRSDSGADNFKFTVPQAFPEGTSLWIRAHALSTPTLTTASDDLVVTLIDTFTEDPVTSAEGDSVNILIGLWRTGTFVVEVRGDLTTRKDQYELEITTLGPMEIEPNETVFEATQLGELASGGEIRVWGSEKNLGVDTYRVGLPLNDPLTPGEMFSVSFQTYGQGLPIEVGVLTDTEVLLVNHRGTRGEVVLDSTVRPAGPFFIQVIPRDTLSSTSPELYELIIRRVQGVADVEPNNTQIQAQVLNGLPARIRSQGRSTDPDIYEIVLPADLAGDETLNVTARHPYTLDNLTVVVRNQIFEELGRSTSTDVELSVALPDPTEGARYYVEIVSSVARVGENMLYEADLSLEAVTPPPAHTSTYPRNTK